MISFKCIDCMEGMRECADGSFDLAIVDPPYFSGPERRSYYGYKTSPIGVTRTYQPSEHWNVPNADYFSELMRVSEHYIVWGCNYFDYPFAPGRIVWDKCNGASTFSDAELAATDLLKTVRLYPYMWNGMMQGKGIYDGRKQQGNKALNEVRIHPTQKPVALYLWLRREFATPGMRILDTHVGSGSSLIACHLEGFDAVGFEIDENYYTKAKERLDQATAQLRMAGM